MQISNQRKAFLSSFHLQFCPFIPCQFLYQTQQCCLQCLHDFTANIYCSVDRFRYNTFFPSLSLFLSLLLLLLVYFYLFFCTGNFSFFVTNRVYCLMKKRRRRRKFPCQLLSSLVTLIVCVRCICAYLTE